MLTQFRQDRRPNGDQMPFHTLIPTQRAITHGDSSWFGLSAFSPDNTRQRISALSGRLAQTNKTGIPNAIKQEFEQRSGLSFEDVRIHYHSNRPAQFNAMAYTQGNHVYIGPGQEQYLRHELGHVVQQKRGLVRPDSFQNGVPVSISPTLEHQADLLPARSSAPPVSRPPVLQFCGIRSMETALARQYAEKDGKTWKDLNRTERRGYYNRVNADVKIQMAADANKESRRKEYMGANPNRYGPIGKKVMEHMLEHGEINDHLLQKEGDPYVLIVQCEKGETRINCSDPYATIDMGHLYPAVTFWNRIGRYTGKRSQCVTDFMQDDNNYQLQDSSQNRSMGPHDETYSPPEEEAFIDFEYIPCYSYNDRRNFDEMEEKLEELREYKRERMNMRAAARDKRLMECVKLYGKKWKQIQQHFPDERWQELKQRYNIIKYKPRVF